MNTRKNKLNEELKKVEEIKKRIKFPDSQFKVKQKIIFLEKSICSEFLFPYSFFFENAKLQGASKWNIVNLERIEKIIVLSDESISGSIEILNKWKKEIEGELQNHNRSEKKVKKVEKPEISTKEYKKQRIEIGVNLYKNGMHLSEIIKITRLSGRTIKRYYNSDSFPQVVLKKRGRPLKFLQKYRDTILNFLKNNTKQFISSLDVKK